MGYGNNEQIVIGADYSELSSKLADKSTYEDSLIKLLHSHSALKSDGVIVKVRDASTIDIGVFYGDDKATIYTMKPDGDGWWRLRDVISRSLTKGELTDDRKKHKNYDADTGTWVKTSPPQYYTTQVGATFSGSFYGTGFNFMALTDNRGGLWDFVIDGVYLRSVSVWSASALGNTPFEIIKGLKEGNHTFVATFKGDDPAHAPSGGAGTARGWCNYNTVEYPTSTSYKTIVPLVDSFTEGVGITVMQQDSRKEFAFSVKPDGAAYLEEWVPEHNVIGVVKDLVYSIYFGNRQITDLSLEPNVYRFYPSVRFISNYNAYHPSEAAALWQGRIDQTINPQGFHTRGKMTFLMDTHIAVGYPGMLAMDKTNTDNDRVVTSKGNRYTLQKDLNDGTKILLTEIPSSVAHFTKDSVNQTALNTVAVIEMYDYKRTLRLGLPGQMANPVFSQLRTDGQRKTYMASHENYTAKAGEIFSFGTSFFVGEIANSTSILPG